MVEPNVGHSQERWPYCAETECHSAANKRYSWSYGTTVAGYLPKQMVSIYMGNEPDGYGEALCKAHARLKYGWY